MNGKNVYSGNINSRPGFVEKRNSNNNFDNNQKYVATIISENLRNNSIEKPDNKLDLTSKEKQKEKNDCRSKEKKLSKYSEEMLKMSVDYNDYDFNEFDKKIVDTYNPYGNEANNAISNYEKIKRIMKQEERYEENFNKFSNNLEDIYDDIKDKITNETLKIIYGEDNFEYIPNDVETYKENWTTGDDEADLLLKIYHSPKIKQRDISAEDYIVKKYNEFAKTIDGKQSFEVQFAKTGVNPSDVVRVNLDKAYYMDDVSIEKNKNQQELYTKKIFENNGGVKNPSINRFGTTNPTNRPTPPSIPKPQQAPQINNGIQNSDAASNDDQNKFVPVTDESLEKAQSDFNRVTPRREEWISSKHNEQLLERASSEKKWELIEKLQNEKLEELIIENGLEVVNLYFDKEKNKEILTLSSVIFDDENKESLKIKVLEKFAKKNKWIVVINSNEETKEQSIIFEFDSNIRIDSNIGEGGTDNISYFNEIHDHKQNSNKITNFEELVESLNVNSENKNDVIIEENINKNINETNKLDYKNIVNNKNNVDNITGVGGMARMGQSSKLKTTISENKQIKSNKNNGFEKNNDVKVKSLAEVLAEKRNKNHMQMHEARINKKVSLKEAIDLYNNEHHIDHGPKKAKRN